MCFFNSGNPINSSQFGGLCRYVSECTIRYVASNHTYIPTLGNVVFCYRQHTGLIEFYTNHSNIKYNVRSHIFIIVNYIATKFSKTEENIPFLKAS